ncbi:unnamed protein product [Ascophyllum nodosum]
MERRRVQSVESIVATDKAMHFADWENKTTAVIAYREGKGRMLKKERANSEALLARRRRLADLYNEEMERWEHEVMNRAETVEERKQRILEKATRLRDARESARRKYVQECYDRQWRDSCDDARTLDSQAHTDWVASQRWLQVAEKAARSKATFRRKRFADEQIRERIRFLEAREREAQEKRERLNRLMLNDLNTQVAYNAERRRQFWEQTSRDDKKELDELRAIVRDEEEKAEARRRDAYARGAEMCEINKARMEMRAVAAKEARERELVLLDYAMKKDTAGEAEDRAKREEEKKVLRQYNDYLKEQMKKEAEDEAEYDAIRQKAEARIWDERDAQLKAQRDAREALMKQVHLGRQEQMRLKTLREMEDLAADAEQARHDKRTFLEEEERENQREIRKHQELLDNGKLLRNQMKDRNAQTEKLRQEEYLAVKQMEAYGRLHQERLDQQAGRVIMYHPLKHTQWYT